MGGACRQRDRRGDSHKPPARVKGNLCKCCKESAPLIEGRGIDTRDVVGPKEEKEQLDTKKRKRTKIARKRKKLPQSVLLLHPALKKARKLSELV